MQEQNKSGIPKPLEKRPSERKWMSYTELHKESKAKERSTTVELMEQRQPEMGGIPPKKITEPWRNQKEKNIESSRVVELKSKAGI